MGTPYGPSLCRARPGLHRPRRGEPRRRLTRTYQVADGVRRPASSVRRTPGPTDRPTTDPRRTAAEEVGASGSGTPGSPSHDGGPAPSTNHRAGGPEKAHAQAHCDLSPAAKPVSDAQHHHTGADTQHTDIDRTKTNTHHIDTQHTIVNTKHTSANTHYASADADTRRHHHTGAETQRFRLGHRSGPLRVTVAGTLPGPHGVAAG
ncbi:MAG TPA: hypothetical protein VFX60_09165 [Micromonospora sp.]|nr:hypothetical protein [Micromonospora sp.]